MEEKLEQVKKPITDIFKSLLDAKIDLTKYENKKNINKEDKEFEDMKSFLERSASFDFKLIQRNEEQIMSYILECKKYLKYSSEEYDIVTCLINVELLKNRLLELLRNIYMPKLDMYSNTLLDYKKSKKKQDILIIDNLLFELEKDQRYYGIDKKKMNPIYETLAEECNELLEIKPKEKTKKLRKQNDKDLLESCFSGVSR